MSMKADCRMDVEDSEGSWEALGSRDPVSREAAMENIRQEVMRRVQNTGPAQENPSSPGAAGTCPSDLNHMLARLLMLSQRCPHADVREKCAGTLQSIQPNLDFVLHLYGVKARRTVVRDLETCPPRRSGPRLNAPAELHKIWTTSLKQDVIDPGKCFSVDWALDLQARPPKTPSACQFRWKLPF
ncbi:hypothetical protein Z043_103110 [Scleropages formosus]|uniref:Uncharacterized protein n=1 Tax=Scleropages formosus TaxID=113540 RepID=A0A0P7Z9Q7_SCLFO|nr:hypothetical protein Z043_103110 [Scleropages formosus]